MRPMTILVAMMSLPMVTASAISTDTLRSSISAYHCGLWQTNGNLYSGPASTALRPGGGWTDVRIKGTSTSGSQTELQGWVAKHTRSYAAEAATRTRTNRGIITGFAGYENSKVDRLVGCETLEAPLLYPYLTADSLGGPLRAETYTFRGSISDSIGCMSVGIDGAYRAALEYRQVDPRPRNVTGDLEVCLGAIYPLMRTQGIGVDLRASRYRHSSQISFVNQLGGVVIQHKTGPESHYVRFAGNGLSTLYTGYGLGGTLSLLPLIGTGWTAATSVDHNIITKQLVDLNRLPMSRLSNYQYTASLAWTGRWHEWLFKPYAQWRHDRRHGSENIFGDAAAGVYPMISSTEMYGASYSRSFLGGAAEWVSPQGRSVLIDSHIGLLYEHESYRQPYYDVAHRYVEWVCKLKTASSVGRGLLTADLGGGRECGEPYATAAVSLRIPFFNSVLGELSAEYIAQRFGHHVTASIGVNF